MRSYGQLCAVAKALDAVGARWSLLIVRELLLRGPSRYTDLLNGLPGIATNLLTDRLRELEDAGVIWREAAPPPVATTLFHLTESGEELRPVLLALGQWGTHLMPEATGDEAFRSHWLDFPVSAFLHDQDPDGPPVVIEVRTGDQPALIQVAGGEVRTRLGTAEHPDLVLTGPPKVVLGALTARLTLAEARRRGLSTKGDAKVLRRLQPVVPAGREAAGARRE
jgi:DNA-binding HxlR family transcriptional regulator